jgi:OOP family OmpA-OmpF porin
MAPRIALAALVLASVPAAWGNYVGVLRPPQTGLGVGETVYAFASPAVLGLSPTLHDEAGYRLKLGYRPSRYFAIEGEIVDFGRPGASPFANPAALAPGFRSTGVGIDTVATLPFWNKFSFYGRFGAYRGDPRTFAPTSALLLTEPVRGGTRMRYGLGMQYDFTKAFGIRAELERYSPLGQFQASDADSDSSFSVGVRWRF